MAMTVRIIPILTLALVFASLHAASANETSPVLPPADSTGQDRDHCAHNSFREVVESLELHEDTIFSNTSRLVRQCRNICQLAYGSGNSDVTGIGAMVAYHIQGVLVLLSGSTLPALFIFFGPRPSEPAGRGLQCAISLMHSVHSTNITFALPFMISAIVRLQAWKDTPLVEIEVLYNLVHYQFLLCIATLVFYSLVPMQWSPRKVCNVVLACCSVLLQISVFVVKFRAMSGRGFDRGSRAADALLYACANEYGYPFTFTINKDITFWSSEVFGPLMEESACGILFVAIFGISLSIAVTFFPEDIYDSCQIFDELAEEERREAADPNTDPLNAMRSTPLKDRERTKIKLFSLPPLQSGSFYHEKLALAAFKTLLFISCIVTFALPAFWIDLHFLGPVRIARQCMKTAAGKDYEEDEWGFGQITIMMMWLPLFQDILAVGWEYYQAGRRQQEDDASAGTGVTAQTEASSTTSGFSGVEASSARQRVRTTEAENTHARAPSPHLQEATNSDQPGVEASSTEPRQGLTARKTFPRNRTGTYLPKSRGD